MQRTLVGQWNINPEGKTEARLFEQGGSQRGRGQGGKGIGRQETRGRGSRTGGMGPGEGDGDRGRGQEQGTEVGRQWEGDRGRGQGAGLGGRGQLSTGFRKQGEFQTLLVQNSRWCLSDMVVLFVSP